MTIGSRAIAPTSGAYAAGYLSVPSRMTRRNRSGATTARYVSTRKKFDSTSAPVGLAGTMAATKRSVTNVSVRTQYARAASSVEELGKDRIRVKTTASVDEKSVLSGEAVVRGRSRRNWDYSGLTNGGGRLRVHSVGETFQLLSYAVGVVVVLDEDFEVAWASEAIERYFGIDRSQLVGREKPELVESTVAPVIHDTAPGAGSVLAIFGMPMRAIETGCIEVVAPAEKVASSILDGLTED